MPLVLREAFEYMAGRRREQIVVTSAGHSSGTWWDVTHDRERTFYLTASMSLSSMFAAGIALGNPELDVWAFSGDGAFVMNPGMLFVERRLNLPNLKHFLISNRCYGSTEEVDLPFRQHADYAAMARAAGIERVGAFEDIDSFKAGFDEAVMTRGHGFVVLEVAKVGTEVRTAAMDGPDVKFRFGRHIEQATGRRIFNIVP